MVSVILSRSYHTDVCTVNQTTIGGLVIMPDTNFNPSNIKWHIVSCCTVHVNILTDEHIVLDNVGSSPNHPFILSNRSILSSPPSIDWTRHKPQEEAYLGLAAACGCVREHRVVLWAREGS